jgi:hypothetical protein
MTKGRVSTGQLWHQRWADVRQHVIGEHRRMILDDTEYGQDHRLLGGTSLVLHEETGFLLLMIGVFESVSSTFTMVSARTIVPH